MELKEEIVKALKERDQELNEWIAKSEHDIKTFGEVQTETKNAIAEMSKKGDELNARLLEIEQKLAKRREEPSAPKSLGAKFVESEQLKDFVARGGKGHSQKFETKQITSGAASGGPGIWSDRLAGVIEEPLRPLSIRDLLDVGTTDSNLIEWVRENVFTNNADVVTEGELKPESNITYERADVPVRTIAHWIHATRQVLSDFRMLQTMIDGRLRLGLAIKEEDQLLLGDGTGENIEGLIPQATSYNTALNLTGDTRIDQMRHAILQVRLAFYPATGIVMSPTDWERIELTKDGENRYLMASPAAVTGPRLWGLPVVQSDAMPVGEFMVGAFSMAATLFDREQASVAVSTEDRDNFVRNMVTILCEERLALAVSRPLAFVHGEFIAPTSS